MSTAARKPARVPTHQACEGVTTHEPMEATDEGKAHNFIFDMESDLLAIEALGHAVSLVSEASTSLPHHACDALSRLADEMHRHLEAAEEKRCNALDRLQAYTPSSRRIVAEPTAPVSAIDETPSNKLMGTSSDVGTRMESTTLQIRNLCKALKGVAEGISEGDRNHGAIWGIANALEAEAKVLDQYSDRLCGRSEGSA